MSSLKVCVDTAGWDEEILKVATWFIPMLLSMLNTEHVVRKIQGPRLDIGGCIREELRGNIERKKSHVWGPSSLLV